MIKTKDSFVYYNSLFRIQLWGSFEFHIWYHLWKYSHSDEWPLPHKTVFEIYVCLTKLLSSYVGNVEMFISWLEACGDAATDKCYSKKKEEMYFLQLKKRVKKTNKQTKTNYKWILLFCWQIRVLRTGLFFFNSKTWFIRLKYYHIFKFLPWWCIQTSSLILTQVNEHLHLIFHWQM